MTLIELLVALLISGIAASIAFILLRDEHSNYSRLRSRVKMQADARDALRIMEGELVNTGLNTGLLFSERDMMSLKCPLAFASGVDSSSFVHVNRNSASNPGDEISFSQYLPNDEGITTCMNTDVR